MPKRVKCPYCGYSMLIFFTEKSECHGITVPCKGRNCGKEFEIKIRNGEQIK